MFNGKQSLLIVTKKPFRIYFRKRNGTGLAMHNALVITIISALFCLPAAAASNVFDYTRDQADQAAAFFKKYPPNDGTILSINVFPDGKAVVYEYVIPFKRNATEAELDAWRYATRHEVASRACQAIKSTPYFNEGFHFRYRYLNREQRVMDEFLVNKAGCR